jgi:hypothetical protein
LAESDQRHLRRGRAETAFSTLHAPLQMLWHSQFVAASLLLFGVHWGPQKRTADGIAWSEADSATLGAHRDRIGLGRGDLASGPADVLVVHAGDGGDGGEHSP